MTETKKMTYEQLEAELAAWKEKAALGSRAHGDYAAQTNDRISTLEVQKAQAERQIQTLTARVQELETEAAKGKDASPELDLAPPNGIVNGGTTHEVRVN